MRLLGKGYECVENDLSTIARAAIIKAQPATRFVHMSDFIKSLKDCLTVFSLNSHCKKASAR